MLTDIPSHRPSSERKVFRVTGTSSRDRT